jgi:hypothetical protein
MCMTYSLQCSSMSSAYKGVASLPLLMCGPQPHIMNRQEVWFTYLKPSGFPLPPILQCSPGGPLH